MKYDVYLTPEATEDLKNIYLYIKNVLQSPIRHKIRKPKLKKLYIPLPKCQKDCRYIKKSRGNQEAYTNAM